MMGFSTLIKKKHKGNSLGQAEYEFSTIHVFATSFSYGGQVFKIMMISDVEGG